MQMNFRLFMYNYYGKTKERNLTMKYQEWLDEWLENYVKPYSKVRTYENYVYLAKDHIKVKLGEYELDSLNPVILQKFFAGLMTNGNIKTGKGLSANSVNSVISVVKTSLRLAFELELCKEYVAGAVKRPRKNEREVGCFNITEQKKLESFVRGNEKHKFFGILLCLYTGLRIGELLALEWGDIDLKNATVSVNKSCHDGKDKNGKFRIFTDIPKTASSKRIIPLPKQILPLLKEHKKNSISSHVIEDGQGAAIFVRSYQRSFELILRKLKIEHKGFHSLRHTFATRALECGMDVKTLADILGHKSPSITLNRYVHSLMEHKVEMMNRLGRIL